jgi:hypothetical protein
VTEALHQCDMCSINESTVTVCRVDTTGYDNAVNELCEAMSVESNGATEPNSDSQFLCQPVVNKITESTSKEALPCCIYNCKENVPEHIAASIMFHRLRNNEDLATHDGLCTTHHVQLNIDKSVERLTKRDGKARTRLTPRGKRRDDQKKEAKKESQKSKKTGGLFSVTEIAVTSVILFNSLGQMSGQCVKPKYSSSHSPR